MTKASVSVDRRLRILALDGGGIKGVFTASVLAELEACTQQSITQHFDLIVGTSTGGIIAIGLGLGLSPKEIVELYRQNGTKIFGAPGRLGRYWSNVRHAFGPKHAQKALRAAFEERLQGKRLGESSVRLVIPTFDTLKGTACTFKTAHHPRLVHEFDIPAIEVALATAAAPTYFQAAQIPSREDAAYVDGGVWANSPALVGIVEAVHFLGCDLSDIDVLSIGTTEEHIDFSSKQTSGILGWNKRLIEIMMAGQVSASLAQARLLVGDRFHRVNFQTNAGAFALDDGRPATIGKLIALGQSVARARTHLEIVQNRFLDGRPADKFCPVATASSANGAAFDPTRTASDPPS